MINPDKPIPPGFELSEVLPKNVPFEKLSIKVIAEDKFLFQSIFPKNGILTHIVQVAFHEMANDLKAQGLLYYTPENQLKALEYVRAKFPNVFSNATPQTDKPTIGQP